MEAHPLSHRQRVEACLSGSGLDRPPVALWRHFPVDDQTPDGLAAATIDFQRAFDFDIVKVTPASSFCLKDWGVQDEWRGATEGTREYTRHIINQPEDWLALTSLDPYQGFLGNQITCLKLIYDELGLSVPVIQTVFNPLAQAKNLAGGKLLLVHIRTHPEAVHAGLKTITESTISFLNAAIHTGIDGIFYAVQHANYGLLSESEYRAFGVAYDLQILEFAREMWLNMLHLHGEDIMFNLLKSYPVQVINWHDRDTSPGLSAAQHMYSGVLCGGLQRERTMVLGSPLQVIAEARDAIQVTNRQRFILGTGCVLPTIAPRANILAARQSVDY